MSHTGGTPRGPTERWKATIPPLREGGQRLRADEPVDDQVVLLLEAPHRGVEPGAEHAVVVARCISDHAMGDEGVLQLADVVAGAAEPQHAAWGATERQRHSHQRRRPADIRPPFLADVGDGHTIHVALTDEVDRIAVARLVGGDGDVAVAPANSVTARGPEVEVDRTARC